MIYFLCGAVIGCTTYIGFGIANYYIKREKLFFELCQFCEKLKTDIGFLLMPLEEILSEASENYISGLKDITEVCKKIIESGNALTSEDLRRQLKCACINEEEKRLICGFFCMLGKSDEKTQLEQIEGYKQRFAAAELSCSADKKKYSSMYKKLGFLLGVAVCLFMI